MSEFSLDVLPTAAKLTIVSVCILGWTIMMFSTAFIARDNAKAGNIGKAIEAWILCGCLFFAIGCLFIAIGTAIN